MSCELACRCDGQNVVYDYIKDWSQRLPDLTPLQFFLHKVSFRTKSEDAQQFCKSLSSPSPFVFQIGMLTPLFPPSGAIVGVLFSNARLLYYANTPLTITAAAVLKQFSG
ncbi:hypothetical protein TNCV_2922381 [Trichonephila clavipes]|nr:hypothetical protein TNCV_2922381 [Trichonephila clavipes]